MNFLAVSKLEIIPGHWQREILGGLVFLTHECILNTMLSGGTMLTILHHLLKATAYEKYMYSKTIKSNSLLRCIQVTFMVHNPA